MYKIPNVSPVRVSGRRHCRYLSSCVARVPEGVSQVLSRPCGGVNHLDGQSGVALGLSGLTGPVGLCNLLPHHHVEPGAGLVAKHKAGVVVVPLRVDEERTAEVHRVELIITWLRISTKLYRGP